MQKQFLICSKATQKNFVGNGDRLTPAEFFNLKKIDSYLRRNMSCYNLLTLHKASNYTIFRRIMSNEHYAREIVDGQINWYMVEKETERGFAATNKMQNANLLMIMVNENKAEFTAENKHFGLIKIG